MSLLALLKLPTPKHFLPPGGAAPMAVPTVSGAMDTPTPAAPSQGKTAGGDASEPRAEAQKLRGAIEARRRQSADLLLRMQKVEPVLKAKVAAASGAERKALAEKQALFAKEMAATERAVARAEADLEAIDSPGTKREELLAILARQKAGGKVAGSTEITTTGLDPDKKGKINQDVTATTTSYANGKATTETVRTQQKVGLDGFTATKSQEKAVTDGTTTARASAERKTNVSLAGKVSTEETKKVEVERGDGSKVGLETRKSREISTKGVSQTQTATRTAGDGSSVSKTAKQGIERGDGGVVATTGTSLTKTDASGTARTTDKSASGGLVAGKDGYGAKGALDGGKSMTTKKGREAKFAVNVHANVTCKIGDPSGEPKLYPVTVTVSFGGSASVSGGVGKQKGAKAGGSVEVKGSVDRTMVVTHHMSEAELGTYAKALEAASKGSKVAATQAEIAIIATGVKEGWDVARQMWQTGGKTIGKKTTDKLVRTGDSAEVSETKTGGIAAKGNVGPVGGGYGVTDTKSKSSKATRNATGGLDVDNKQEKGRQTDKSMSMQAGVVALEVGNTKVHKTRFGYEISIEAKNDPDGKLLEALGRCDSELDYETFIRDHVGKVKVIGRTKGKTDAEGTNIAVSVGGAKLKLGTKQSVDTETTTDGTGKVTGKKTVGGAGAGGEFLGFADSVDDQALAQTDGKGNSTLTLTSTKKQNYGSRASEKKQQAFEKLTGVGKLGGLKRVAGGEDDDNGVEDVTGLKLANEDLLRIGQVAVNSMPSWRGVIQRGQERKDWEKAGQAIVRGGGRPSVVAHALAEFIGTDRTERLETVRLMIRGGYKQTGGKASEFPDSLRDIRADYDLVTDDDLGRKMDTLANKQGDPAAAKECRRLLAIVDRIQPRVEACKDFADGDTKTEMMSELTERRTILNRGVEGYGGKLKPEDDPKVLADEGNRLMKLCNTYGVEQERLVDKLDDQAAWKVYERADGKKLIKQLENMQSRWSKEFDRLQDNYAKRKIALPEFVYARGTPQIKPNEALVADYEKKFVRRGAS